MQPSTPISDPRFIYRCAAATDVTLTWRKFGWTPPSQNQKLDDDQKQWVEDYEKASMA